MEVSYGLPPSFYVVLSGLGVSLFFIYGLGSAILPILLLYLCFDVHYFARLLYTAVALKFYVLTKDVFVTYTTYGFCFSNDLDFMVHMNNSRYLREMDFNRLWFFGHSGIYNELQKRGGTMVQSGSSIRYRKPITFGQVFRCELKVLYWDERSLYLEQRMITVHDGFVRAIALTKQTCIRVLMPEIINATMGAETNSPVPSPELIPWMNSNDLSSNKLKLEGGRVQGNGGLRSAGPFGAADTVMGPVTSQPCACTRECTCTCPGITVTYDDKKG